VQKLQREIRLVSPGVNMCKFSLEQGWREFSIPD